MGDAKIDALVSTAIEVGVNFFDHADIYGQGKSEEVFASSLSRLEIPRDAVILQSKCGICDGYYDSSAKHIRHSTEGILKRLDTDYIDVLLIHRPDALMDIQEVAQAIHQLKKEGKVLHFGVSNMNSYQMQLLTSALDTPIVTNQIQLGLGQPHLIEQSMRVGMAPHDGVSTPRSSTVPGDEIVNYCQLNHVTLQPWSPLGVGFFEGCVINHPQYATLNQSLKRMGEEKGSTPEAIAIAWLLRHPAAMQPIVGTTNAQRLISLSQAAEITLSRKEWYELYRGAGCSLP
ncbi:MAG: aldo/keto reductase [Spirochaetales bacterium]|nr:aldo/keto reductase [Spirochaetales bacterium]